MTRYRTIVADPPWEYPDGFNGFGQRRALPYASMTPGEIKALPVGSLLEREGYVFLWAPSKYLPFAASVLVAWGCDYRQTLTWDKGATGKGLGGMFATNTEFVMIGQSIGPGTHAHGKRTRGERIDRSCFQWPRGRHSEKPEAFMDLVERVAPGPYLELFARRKRIGWDVWGDEVDSDVVIEGGAI